MCIHIQIRYLSNPYSLAVFLLGLVTLTNGGCSPRFKCTKTQPPDYGAASTVARGNKPAIHLTHDPQDAQVAIDPACSTYCYEYFGEGWQTAVSGTVDLTIDPTCTGPSCTLTMSRLQLGAEDFTSSGHAISEVDIGSYRYDLAIWQDDNTFALPKWELGIYVGYKDDGATGGHNDINAMNLSWGTLDRNYENFSLNGDTTRGDWLTSSFSLCGHVVARPPVPVLTPTGVFQKDSPEGAHITFSSAQSHDPDNDIRYNEWRIDNQHVAQNVDSLSTVLSVGTHTVALKVIDSRSVVKSTSTTVGIVDGSTFANGK